MKLLTGFLILISVQCLAAEYNPNLVVCDKPKINLSKMNENLSAIKRDQLGNRIKSRKFENQFKETETLKYIRNLSREIQNELFGKEILQIRFIPNSTSFVLSGSPESGMHLEVSVGLAQHILKNKLYENGESLLAFIMAHEISHTVQIIKEDPKGLSVNGNLHDGIESNEFIKKFVLDHVKSRGLDSSDNLINKISFANLYIYSHQEVDAYALLLLQKLGIQIPSSKDFKLILNVIGTLKKNEMNQAVIKSSIEQRYNDSLMDCFIKTRLNYIDYFEMLSKKSVTLGL